MDTHWPVTGQYAQPFTQLPQLSTAEVLYSSHGHGATSGSFLCATHTCVLGHQAQTSCKDNNKCCSRSKDNNKCCAGGTTTLGWKRCSTALAHHPPTQRGETYICGAHTATFRGKSGAGGITSATVARPPKQRAKELAAYARALLSGGAPRALHVVIVTQPHGSAGAHTVFASVAHASVAMGAGLLTQARTGAGAPQAARRRASGRGLPL